VPRGNPSCGVRACASVTASVTSPDAADQGGLPCLAPRAGGRRQLERHVPERGFGGTVEEVTINYDLRVREMLWASPWHGKGRGWAGAGQLSKLVGPCGTLFLLGRPCDQMQTQCLADFLSFSTE